MKTYQDKWLVDLDNARNIADKEYILKDILNDDTGGTDELTTWLANELLETYFKIKMDGNS